MYCGRLEGRGQYGVVHAYIIPIGAAHLQAAGAASGGGDEVTIVDDVFDKVTALPVLRASAPIALHAVRGGEVVP